MMLFMAVSASFLTSIGFSAEVRDDYRLGPGDQVDIIIHGEEDYLENTHYTVRLTGEVSLPWVGEVRLAGLTAAEAERAVRDRLKDGYILDPQVKLNILSYNSQVVDVLGAVKQPNQYSLEGETTLRALLAVAGGIDAARSSGFVTVTREGERTRLALKELEGPGGGFSLRSGDVVEVEQSVNVFVTGEVMNPGAVSYVEGITVSQALIIAGGRGEYARLSGAYVIRGNERISVNLKRVLKGKESDVALQPGDRVVIPHSTL
ncbi:MAG: polysaccharide biosynthesis/export family protein [Myxococcota bacterium]